jgi:hypothetical protein
MSSMVFAMAARSFENDVAYVPIFFDCNSRCSSHSKPLTTRGTGVCGSRLLEEVQRVDVEWRSFCTTISLSTYKPAPVQSFPSPAMLYMAEKLFTHTTKRQASASVAFVRGHGNLDAEILHARAEVICHLWARLYPRVGLPSSTFNDDFLPHNSSCSVCSLIS